MKILLVNTYDKGGAARACIKLHLALLDNGIDSTLLLKHKTQDIPNAYELNHTDSLLKMNLLKLMALFSKVLTKIRQSFYKTFKERFLLKRNIRFEKFSFPDTKIDITKSIFYKNADIVHLNWVADFIDYKTFFKKNKKPLVWTIVDENPYSGGEHYKETYEGISQNGLLIKRKINLFEKKMFERNLKIKKNALKDVNNLKIIAMSNWLLEESKKSSLFNKYQHVQIGYGLTSKDFRALNKNLAREVFNLPIDKNIVLFLSDTLTHVRKGYGLLIQSIEQLNKTRDDLFYCTVGQDTLLSETVKNTKIINFINDDRLLCLLYNTADVIVLPSLMDNLPYTFIESQCCGVPAIVFPTGGMKDEVIQFSNGIITDSLTSESLTNSISLFFERKNDFLSKEELSKRALDKYNQSKYVKEYISLYNETLSNKIKSL